jgi:hypothetical protein
MDKRIIRVVHKRWLSPILWSILLSLPSIMRIEAQDFTLGITSLATASQSGGGDFSLISSIGEGDAEVGIVGGDFNLLAGFWGAATVFSSPPLSLIAEGGNIILSWPESAGPDFLLEETLVLANPSTNTSWSTVTATHELTGGFYRVRLSIGSGNHFYRLHQPQ